MAAPAACTGEEAFVAKRFGLRHPAGSMMVFLLPQVFAALDLGLIAGIPAGMGSREVQRLN